MIRLTLVDSIHNVFYTQVSPDDAMLLTPMGRKRADQFVGSTKDSYNVEGQDADGEVVYACKYGGTCAPPVRVRHVSGGTGPGYESRALSVAVLGMDVSVTYGTDGAGVVQTPTAQQVVDLVNGDTAAAGLLTASIGGDGTGLVGLTSYEDLAGGADDGDCLKFEGSPNICRRVSLVEAF